MGNLGHPVYLQPALLRICQNVMLPPREGTELDREVVEDRFPALNEDVVAPEGLGGGNDLAVVEVPHGLGNVLGYPHHFVRREAVLAQVKMGVKSITFLKEMDGPEINVCRM